VPVLGVGPRCEAEGGGLADWLPSLTSPPVSPLVQCCVGGDDSDRPVLPALSLPHPSHRDGPVRRRQGLAPHCRLLGLWWLWWWHELVLLARGAASFLIGELPERFKLPRRGAP
jgi:hypothetical protein